MTNFRFKQILIALVYFFIFAVIVFSIYLFLKPEPSCSDGIKNQGEERVDCGGPCSPCQSLQKKDLDVLWAKSFVSQKSFPQDMYDLVAKIENPNLNYGSGEFSYEFKVYDSRGELMNTYKGSDYVLSNQTKYLIEPRVKLNRPPHRVTVSFDGIEKWRELKPETVSVGDLAVQDLRYRLLGDSKPGYSQLKALLINRTNYGFDTVNIKVLLFDSSNNLLSIRSTEINTLLSGEKREFTITWFGEINGEVASIETEPETNLFNPDNYLSGVPQEIEKFQQYQDN